MIRKVKGGYVVMSEAGKRLSKPMSHKGAQHRLAQIEWFKRHPKK